MDERSLTDTSVRILSGTAPAEIARLLADGLKSVTGHRACSVFFFRDGALVPARAEDVPGLAPEGDVLDAAWKEEDWLALPWKTFGPVAFLPLRLKGEKIGLAALAWPSHPPSAEEFRAARYLADHAAFALHTSRILSTRLDQYALLNNILDNISNGLVAVDLEDRVTLINRNACTLLETGVAVVGRPLADLLPAPFLEASKSLRAEAVFGKSSGERELVHRLSGGSEVPIALSVSPLRDAGYVETGCILVIRDLTASRELERLRRVDEMKSRFVASVSHELKTPLTSIKAYTEALTDMVRDAQGKKFLGVIDEEADRLLDLINDLLSAAHIQSGQMKLDLASTTVREVVDDALRIWSPPPTHRLVIDVPADLPPTTLDRAKIKEVLLNFLTNAVKYSPRGGEVRISARRVEEALRIEVKDAGPGIPRPAQARLFQPFYRVDDSLAAEVGGTGLGLSIAKAIVDRHGGRIGVDSEPGRGSAFYFFLPLR